MEMGNFQVFLMFTNLFLDFLPDLLNSSNMSNHNYKSRNKSGADATHITQLKDYLYEKLKNLHLHN